MGRRRCCCGCVEYADDFNRDDASTLGNSWEMVGYDADWRIDGHRAKAVKGIALLAHEMPDKYGAIIISVDLLDMRAGDVFEVIFAWKDWKNYYFVRWAPTEGTASYTFEETWTVLIGTVLDGVETIITDHDVLVDGCQELMRVNNHAPITPGGQRDWTVKIYYDRHTVRVVDGTTSDMWACLGPPDPDANRVGLARPDTNTRDLLYDNFWVSDHNVHALPCEYRSCGCGMLNCIGNTITGTLEFYSGDEANQITDPVSFTMYRRAYRDRDVWVSEPAVPGYDYMGSGPQCFAFVLECYVGNGIGSQDQSPWLLQFTGNANCATGSCFASVLNNADLTPANLIAAYCAPFLLVWELDLTWEGFQVHHYDSPGRDYFQSGYPPGQGGMYRFTITE